MLPELRALLARISPRLSAADRRAVEQLCDRATLRVLIDSMRTEPPDLGKILRVLGDADRPLSALMIACRGRLPYGPSLRAHLAALLASGDVILLASGYWLASRSPDA